MRDLIDFCYNSVVAKIISLSLDIADPVTKPVVQTQPSSGAVEYVGNVTLTCLVEGGTRLVYQWLKNGRPVHPRSTNSPSPQNNSLHIAPVTREDIGNYSCLVKNPVSEMESDTIMPTIYCKFFKNHEFSSGKFSQGWSLTLSSSDATWFLLLYCSCNHTS